MPKTRASWGSNSPAQRKGYRTLRYWADLRDGRGLPPILLRNMRNSWRTFGEWELHMDYNQLETLMGHVGATVTARHYNRPDESMLVDAVADAYDRAGYFGEFKTK